MNGLIITGGSLSRSFLQSIIKQHQFEFVIAVDGGLKIAQECQVSLDYIVGDFDTIDPEIIQSYKEQAEAGAIQTKIKQLIPEKDMTDTHVAISLAADHGVDELVILGGLGSRFDHSFANVHLLYYALSRQVQAVIINENNRISLIQSKTIIHKNNQYGNYISLIPFSEQVSGVTLTGMKYPLTDYTFKLGDSIGVSNEITGEDAIIELNKGVLLVIESKD